MSSWADPMPEPSVPPATGLESLARRLVRLLDWAGGRLRDFLCAVVQSLAGSGRAGHDSACCCLPVARIAGLLLHLLQPSGTAGLCRVGFVHRDHRRGESRVGGSRTGCGCSHRPSRGTFASGQSRKIRVQVVRPGECRIDAGGRGGGLRFLFGGRKRGGGLADAMDRFHYRLGTCVVDTAVRFTA